PVSVLVNKAASVRFGPIAETEPEAWRQVIDINLTGAYLGSARSRPRSQGGRRRDRKYFRSRRDDRGLASYVASTWGLLGPTKTAAVALALHEISVNSIHPGGTHTPMTAGPDTAALAAAAVRHWRSSVSQSRKRSHAWCCSSRLTRQFATSCMNSPAGAATSS